MTKGKQIVLLALSLVLSGAVFAAKKSGLKTYAEILKGEVQKQEGLFDVYRTADDKLYFSIADTLLAREFLFGSRIAEVSSTTKAYAGEIRKKAQLISFERHGNKLFWTAEKKDYQLDDEENTIVEAHERSSLSPVFHTSEILAVENGKLLIDVSDFYGKEIAFITPFASKGKPGKLEKTSSYLKNTQVFKKNIEVQHNFNFASKSTPFRTVVNRSLLLLPKEPMQKRYYDRRMNFFAGSERVLTDEGMDVQSRKFINRFRVEPKPEDRKRYFEGEMVEPAKQIVVYIDNGLPDKWYPYVKAGLEEWNKAFEQINFKNVIVAKPFPENDPNFNPNDLENTIFRYVPNATINAQGPRYVDPRSGETLRGDIIWYHNVIKKLHDWYFIQTAAANPAARERLFETETLGRLIRYAVAHEMGHVLGFQHNMRSSAAYRVEDLRDPAFVAEFGTTPSIMDYARFNYVAQPGDGVTSFTPPLLGLFDYYAIKWGYQPIDVKTSEEEYATLNQWILEKANDERYRFIPQFAMGIPADPAAQTEAIGDDAMLAGNYGIKNLQFINQHLIEWTTEQGKDFDYLRDMNKEVSKQYNRYLGHVISYLGGANQYFGVEGEDIPLFTPIAKEKQQAALHWLINELGDNQWLLNPAIIDRVGSLEKDWIKMNVSALDNMMSGFIFQRLQEHPENYRLEQYLADLDQAIFSISESPAELTRMQMILQQSYVRNLIKLAHSAAAKGKSERENAGTDWFTHGEIQCSCGVDHDHNHEQSLVRQTSAKINHVDHFLEMAAVQQLEQTKARIAKLNKKHKTAHYQLLNTIVGN